MGRRQLRRQMYHLQGPLAPSARQEESELLKSTAELTSCHELTLPPTKATEGRSQAHARRGDWQSSSLRACGSTV